TIEHVRSCIGQPWQQFYEGLLPEEAKSRALDFHAAISRRELDAIDNGRARLFEGTQDVLRELARRGYKLALISNASTAYFEAAIAAFGLREHFSYTECLGDRDGYPKHAMLASAMQALGATRACMVGDKAGDFQAALHHGFPCVAMTHGYGSEEEFALATVRATAMRDLLDLLR
ncbi:MAG: HAD family hydrolase, partial [Planctomycetota bacterium]